MRHPYFHKAVISCYEQLIANEAQPNYFLNFTVDPCSIDVNIHPTKNEIKFENESPIWQIISAAVKEALGKYNVVPSIDFDNEDALSIPIFKPTDTPDEPSISVDPNYNPFATTGMTASKSSSMGGDDYSRPRGNRNTAADVDWQSLYGNFTKGSTLEQSEASQPSSGFDMENIIGSKHNIIDEQDSPKEQVLIEASRKYMQLKGKYILSPQEDGLLVVDQHRAHIKVLYDNYMMQMSGENVISQRILFPEIINLTPAQNALMLELEPDMAKLGFCLSELSAMDWAINGIPQGLGGVNIKDLILQILDSVESGGASLQNMVYQHIALKVAQAGAFAYGRTLNDEEMEALVVDLFSRKEPNFTPDGKRTYNVLTFNQIAKLF